MGCGCGWGASGKSENILVGVTVNGNVENNMADNQTLTAYQIACVPLVKQGP